MIKFSYMLMLVFIFLPELIYCRPRRKNNKTAKTVTVNRKNFDIINLAQSWPQTNCFSLNDAWTDEAPRCSPCEITTNGFDWTLHGLWPSSVNGEHPARCKNVKFNASLLNNDLIEQLKYKWPTYNKKFTNEMFWAYEWDKHGTCSLGLNETNNISKYFAQSLKLLNDYNMGIVLQESDIVPGYEYAVTDIMQAINKSLGVRGYVQCVTNRFTGEQFLSQITLCLDKSFTLINCGNTNQYLSNCKKSENVIYSNSLKTC